VNCRIVVFGLSGVGKTTACRSFTARHPEFVYISASELLSTATGLPVERLRDADAKDIVRYQSLLATALNHRLGEHRGSNVIIDGHSIIDNGREVVRIPIDVVRSLRPSGLILLEGSPDDILRRRRADGTLRPQRSPAELALQLALAKETARSYADELNVPIQFGTVNDGFELDGLVDAISQRTPS
jgi:adenylate kinase